KGDDADHGAGQLGPQGVRGSSAETVGFRSQDSAPGGEGVKPGGGGRALGAGGAGGNAPAGARGRRPVRVGDEGEGRRTPARGEVAGVESRQGLRVEVALRRPEEAEGQRGGRALGPSGSHALVLRSGNGERILDCSTLFAVRW